MKYIWYKNIVTETADKGSALAVCDNICNCMEQLEYEDAYVI